jgi:hypothetical protein
MLTFRNWSIGRAFLRTRGDDDHELLNRVHCTVLPRTYAEIGLNEARSFSLRCCSMTSDDFLARHDLRREWVGSRSTSLLSTACTCSSKRNATSRTSNSARAEVDHSSSQLRPCHPADRVAASALRGTRCGRVPSGTSWCASSTNVLTSSSGRGRCANRSGNHHEPGSIVACSRIVNRRAWPSTVCWTARPTCSRRCAQSRAR